MTEPRQSRVLCDHFIEGSDDPWAGTYCKLRTGHEGEHSPHYPNGGCGACGGLSGHPVVWCPECASREALNA